jgi:hypothetical protein
VAQPVVSAALQAAVLITATVPADGSTTYRVWVTSSKLESSRPACGSAIGISAIGAQPARSCAVQVAPLITSISGLVALPA